MEQQSNPKHLETDEEDGGFAMEFRIGVVEDIEAQVEEMMRLGALGYFKEARQLSQSIAPAHQRTFEVVFEQLRLMLDQGAYTDLIERAESHPKNVCTSEQSDLIALMVAIAHVSISGVGQTHPSDTLSQFQHVGLLIAQLRRRLSDGQWTTQEVRLSSNSRRDANVERYATAAEGRSLAATMVHTTTSATARYEFD